MTDKRIADIAREKTAARAKVSANTKSKALNPFSELAKKNRTWRHTPVVDYGFDPDEPTF